jgi:hypothetical protein
LIHAPARKGGEGACYFYSRLEGEKPDERRRHLHQAATMRTAERRPPRRLMVMNLADRLIPDPIWHPADLVRLAC